jgi:hypothetical protein
VNPTAGIVAAASYAVLSVSPLVQGFAAHATHFVMLPVLSGALLLLNQSGRQSMGRLFASGLFFGIGLLMKQPAVFFAFFGAIYLFLGDIRAGFGWKKLLLRNLVFGGGVIVPFGFTCLFLWYAGVFDKFWFWTIDYAREYGTLVPLSGGIQGFKIMTPDVIGSGWALWTMAGIGLIICVWRIRSRPQAVFLVGLFLASALAVCAGFYFRPHYFVLVLPAVSLLVGTAVAAAERLLNTRSSAIRIVAFLLAGAAMGLPVFRERNFLFRIPINSIPRYVYGESPFAESIRIGEYIREHTNPDDTIAVLGSEPQIYFYANRHSATGYIYTYGLMEPQKYAHEMQREMIHEIELARPKYLVLVAIDDSWTLRGNSELDIFTWANKYSAANYTAVGFVNIVAADRTDYFFGDIPASVRYLRDYILIYERKS